MNESELVNTWLETAYSDWYEIKEVPVGGPESRKFIDILLLEEFPFASEEELYQAARREKDGYVYNQTTDEFRSPVGRNKLQFILERIDSPSVKVRVFEAKMSLRTKALGQILLYRAELNNTYDEDTELDIVECGIVHGNDDPIVRRAADTYDVSVHFVCPSCEWIGRSSDMVDLVGERICPQCSGTSDDITSAIVSRRNHYDKNLNINGKCIRFRSAALEYFDAEAAPEDPIGYTDASKDKKIAAAISIARGQDAEAVEAYQHEFNGSTIDLYDEFEIAIREIGVELEDEHPPVKADTNKIGPVLPWTLAVLDFVHGIDIEEALQTYGNAIDRANEQDPAAPGSYNWS